MTYEDMTELFVKAARGLDLTIHPEYWLNTRSLEREFACTCHMGECEEAEFQSSCTASFTWGSLDTALALEGPAGVCEFFHEPGEDCHHLRTSAIPPLVMELAYTLPLHGAMIAEERLLALTQMLRLRASEHSHRTVETRPGVQVVLQDNRLHPESLTLQQRVEIPLWHPLGIHGLHDDVPLSTPLRQSTMAGDDESITIDKPNPEEWLPQVMQEVCQDIVQVLAALDSALSYHSSER